MQYSAQVVARVPPDLVTAFGLAAKVDGRSQSEALREAMRIYVTTVDASREHERAGRGGGQWARLGLRSIEPRRRSAPSRAAPTVPTSCEALARSGVDPPQPGDEGEPGTPGAPLDFQRFGELTAELSSSDRLALALALPGLDRELWRAPVASCRSTVRLRCTRSSGSAPGPRTRSVRRVSERRQPRLGPSA